MRRKLKLFETTISKPNNSYVDQFTRILVIWKKYL